MTPLVGQFHTSYTVMRSDDGSGSWSRVSIGALTLSHLGQVCLTVADTVYFSTSGVSAFSGTNNQ